MRLSLEGQFTTLTRSHTSFQTSSVYLPLIKEWPHAIILPLKSSDSFNIYLDNLSSCKLTTVLGVLEVLEDRWVPSVCVCVCVCVCVFERLLGEEK